MNTCANNSRKKARAHLMDQKKFLPRIEDGCRVKMSQLSPKHGGWRGESSGTAVEEVIIIHIRTTMGAERNGR